MSTDTRNIRDTREDFGTPPPRLDWPELAPGELAELRVFLQDLLQIPPTARRFSVTFAVGEAVVVNVEYLPREAPR